MPCWVGTATSFNHITRALAFTINRRSTGDHYYDWPRSRRGTGSIKGVKKKKAEEKDPKEKEGSPS
jgi:hypothetical protein